MESNLRSVRVSFQAWHWLLLDNLNLESPIHPAICSSLFCYSVSWKCPVQLSRYFQNGRSLRQNVMSRRRRYKALLSQVCPRHTHTHSQTHSLRLQLWPWLFRWTICGPLFRHPAFPLPCNSFTQSEKKGDRWLIEEQISFWDQHFGFLWGG